MKKKDLSGNSTANEAIFKKEFDAIIQDKKIKTEYKIIETPFEETRSIHEKLLRAMVGELEEKAEKNFEKVFGFEYDQYYFTNKAIIEEIARVVKVRI